MNSQPQTRMKDDESAADESTAATPASNASASAGNTRKAASAFRTISEVADDLGVQQHVLRFWETKFSQVRPLKRGGGRRYYRPEDVTLLKSIHHLLYTEGYTIKGVQKLLREQGKNKVVQNNTPAAPKSTEPKAAAPVARKESGLSQRQKSMLESMLGDLKVLRELVGK